MKFDDFGVNGIEGIKYLEIKEPGKRKKGIMVKDVDELIDKLRNEAKVL